MPHALFFSCWEGQTFCYFAPSQSTDKSVLTLLLPFASLFPYKASHRAIFALHESTSSILQTRKKEKNKGSAKRRQIQSSGFYAEPSSKCRIHKIIGILNRVQHSKLVRLITLDIKDLPLTRILDNANTIAIPHTI
jgi:hypothetical protein